MPFILYGTFQMIYLESCFMYNFMDFVYIYLIYLLYEKLIFLIISVYFAQEVGFFKYLSFVWYRKYVARDHLIRTYLFTIGYLGPFYHKENINQ